jgi:hypothetical protein
MSINCQPVKLRDEIAAKIQSALPREEDVEEVRWQLLRQKAEATSELIVECFYRCLVTDELQRRYRIGLDDLPSCVNSSHVAARRVCWVGSPHAHQSIQPKPWARAWDDLRERHPEADNWLPDQRRRETLRHADLYVVAQDRIVSVEFKYVSVQGVKHPEAIVEQMQRYVDKHAATLLVVYSDSDDKRVGRSMVQLTKLLDPPVPVVLLRGPAILPAKKPR